MNLLLRWMRFDAQRSATCTEPDPGDMGTAFGLEAILALQQSELATPATAAEDDARWRQRLDRRPLR